MKTSMNGVNLIKKYEGLRLKAYKCIPTEKYYTIGYGHYGADVLPDMVITEDVATDLLCKDLYSAELCVSGYNANYNFTQSEFDALVSFTFNCGSGNLCRLTANGTRTIQQIADKMLEYNKSSGIVIAGLTKRRKEERELFLSDAVKNIEIDYTIHTVVKGESLWSIASKELGSGLKWTKLYSFNDLTSTRLEIGQVIKIPRKKV